MPAGACSTMFAAASTGRNAPSEVQKTGNRRNRGPTAIPPGRRGCRVWPDNVPRKNARTPRHANAATLVPDSFDIFRKCPFRGCSAKVPETLRLRPRTARPKENRPTGPIFTSFPSEPAPAEAEAHSDACRMRISFSDSGPCRIVFGPSRPGRNRLRNPLRGSSSYRNGIRFQNGTGSAPFSLRQEHRRNRPPATNLRPSVGRAHPSVRRSGARPARRSFPRPR